jgi:hypothetical protein
MLTLRAQPEVRNPDQGDAGKDGKEEDGDYPNAVGGAIGRGRGQATGGGLREGNVLQG